MSKTASLSTLPPLAMPAPVPAAARSRSPLITRNRLTSALGVVAFVVAATYGIPRLSYAFSHEDTDDAQVEGDISPVLPRVSGYVTQVLVKDNEHVAAGEPLIQIDDRELDLKIASSQAALSGAEAALVTARANTAQAKATLAVAEAAIDVAMVRDAKAADDLRRDTSLFQTSAISDRQLTDTRADSDVAKATLVSARRAAEAGRTAVAVMQAQETTATAQVDARKADLSYAELQRSYASVTAPIAGIVSRKNVEPGQFVQAGQTLLSITSDQGVWVVANFKETQMAHLRAGQPVDVTVDTYRGATFHGRVDSISGATGARFALLPPDNASGNFIKVTQRVPVKIDFDAIPDSTPLRPGMSVDAAVLTKG